MSTKLGIVCLATLKIGYTTFSSADVFHMWSPFDKLFGVIRDYMSLSFHFEKFLHVIFKASVKIRKTNLYKMIV